MQQNIMIQGKHPKLIHAEDHIILANTPDGMQIHVNPDADIDTLYKMIFTFLPHLMENSATLSPDATEEEKLKQRTLVYDYVNILVSSLLKNFIPDKELRPDLTEEAILKMENQLLDESYAAASEEQKAEIHSSIEDAKDSLLRKKKDSSSEPVVEQVIKEDSVD